MLLWLWIFKSYGQNTPLVVSLNVYDSILLCTVKHQAYQEALVGKKPPANAGDSRDASLTPGSGRFP